MLRNNEYFDVLNDILCAETGFYRLMGDVLRMMAIHKQLRLMDLVNKMNTYLMNTGQNPILIQDVIDCVDFLRKRGFLIVKSAMLSEWSGRNLGYSIIEFPEYPWLVDILRSDEYMEQVTLYS